MTDLVDWLAAMPVWVRNVGLACLIVKMVAWAVHRWPQSAPPAPAPTCDARAVTTRAPAGFDRNVEVSTCVWERSGDAVHVHVWQEGEGWFEVTALHFQPDSGDWMQCDPGVRYTSEAAAIAAAEQWWAEHEAAKAVPA